MTTAYQCYILPIEEANAAEQPDHSWDREVDGLHAQDIAENGLQAQLERVGSDLNIYYMADEKRWRLLDLLTEHQSYPKAVQQFLAEERE